MLDKIKGLVSAQDIVEPLLKIAIVGEPGIGKSWLAVTAPKPVLDIDFDGRKSSLAGKAGVFVKSYVDIDINNPKAISDLETDINSFEYEKQKGNPTPATYILDSMTYGRKFTEAELIRQQGTLGRSLKVGVSTIKIGSGWDIINGNRAYLEYLINRLSVLGNLIAIFHTQDEKDNAKGTFDKQGNKIVAYSGRKTVQPQYLSSLLSIFNDVWLIDVDYSSKRYVQTGITDTFIGKCSLKGLNPEKEEPDIEKMLIKHRAIVEKEKANAALTTSAKP